MESYEYYLPTGVKEEILEISMDDLEIVNTILETRDEEGELDTKGCVHVSGGREEYILYKSKYGYYFSEEGILIAYDDISDNKKSMCDIEWYDRDVMNRASAILLVKNKETSVVLEGETHSELLKILKNKENDMDKSREEVAIEVGNISSEFALGGLCMKDTPYRKWAYIFKESYFDVILFHKDCITMEGKDIERIIRSNSQYDDCMIIIFD